MAKTIPVRSEQYGIFGQLAAKVAQHLERKGIVLPEASIKMALTKEGQRRPKR